MYEPKSPCTIFRSLFGQCSTIMFSRFALVGAVALALAPCLSNAQPSARTFIPPPQTPTHHKPADNEGTSRLASVPKTVALLSAPHTDLAFYPDNIAIGGTSQIVISLNNTADSPIAGLQFSDSLPAGVHIADSPSAINACGGTLTALPNETTVSLSGGTIAAQLACAIYVNVTGVASGSWFDHTGIISSDNAAAGNDAGASLIVTDDMLLQAPSISTGFTPASITAGGYSQLSIKLTNNDPAKAVRGAQLYDVYPGSIGTAFQNAPNAVIVSDDCSPNVYEGYPADKTIQMYNATIPPGGSCTIVFNVIGASVGNWVNQTGSVSSGNANTAPGASASLTVVGGTLLQAPAVQLSFSPATALVGQTSDMQVTLTNPSASPVEGAQYKLEYLPGLVNASSGVIVGNTCGGTLIALPDTAVSMLSGASIPAMSACSITVRVTGLWANTYAQSTGLIYSANASAAGPSIAALTVNNDPSLLSPPGVTQSFAPSTVEIGDPWQLTIALSNPNASAITGVHFADAYPPHITNASSGVVESNTCGGTIIAATNGDSAELTGGVIPPTGCSVVINLTAVASGAYWNHTGSVTSANANPGADTSARLSVTYAANGLLSPPAATEAFAPSTIPAGIVSQMTIELSNPNSTAITGAAFSDVYPSGMVNAPSSVIVSNSCGGNLAAEPVGTSVALSEGTIPASGACTVVVAVTGTAADSYINSSGVVTSTNAAFGAEATATLTVTGKLPAPTVTKSFAPDHVVAGDSAAPSLMSIELTNNTPYELTGVQFSDDYPTPLRMSNAPWGVIVANTCGGTLVADPNATSTALSGGSIHGSQSCVVKIQVVGTSVGTAINNTGIITSDNADDGASASATLTVTNGVVSQQTITFMSTAPLDAVVGGAAYHATATSDSGLPVTLTIDGASANVCTIDNGGVVSFIGAGICTIDANQGGNATYAPAPQVQQPFAVASAGGTASQTIQFTSAAPVDAIVAGPTYHVTATAGSHLPVVLTIDGMSANVCTIDNGDVSFIGAGTCTIDANQGGDATYAPAPQIQQAFAVASAGGTNDSQMIWFQSTAPTNAVVGGPAYLAIATATSQLPVVLTIDGTSSAVCVINDGTVTFIGAGTCTVDANQGGDGTYAPAPQAQQAFDVASASGTGWQEIHFTSTAPVDATVAGTSYFATAAATSQLPVVLTIDGASATVCTINNGAVSFIGAGTCTIDANQGGDAMYAAASQVQQSFAVADAGGTESQTIMFTSSAPAGAFVGGPTYLATAVASSELPVVLTVNGTSAIVCAINNGIVTFIGPGTCTIDANQGGDATHAPAPQVQQSFVVESAGGPGTQTIHFTSVSPSNAVVAGASYVATATATSELPVVLTIDDTSATICTINNGTVTFIGAGTCTIDANQGGDAAYAPAPQAQQSFPVAGAGGVDSQTIHFTSIPPVSEAVGGPSYLATAIATSGLPVVLTIDSTASSVCAINNGTVTFIGAGTCTIDANQGGDGFYAPAPQLQQAIVVTPVGTPTVRCQLPRQVDIVGDTINFDLSLLFAPPAGESLNYSGTSLPPSLSIVGSLLTGTLDVPGSPYASTLTATTVPGGLAASENVIFEVLPVGEILLRNGFDNGTTQVCP